MTKMKALLLLLVACASRATQKVDKVKEVFDRFDMNEDNYINRRELSVLVRTRASRTRSGYFVIANIETHYRDLGRASVPVPARLI